MEWNEVLPCCGINELRIQRAFNAPRLLEVGCATRASPEVYLMIVIHEENDTPHTRDSPMIGFCGVYKPKESAVY